MATFEAQYGAALDLARALRKEFLAVRRTLDSKLDQLVAMNAALSIPTRWNGTVLEILGPDGTWIAGPDLKGEQGEQGERRPLEVRLAPDLLSFQWRAADDDEDWQSFADTTVFYGLRRPFGVWDANDAPYPEGSVGLHNASVWVARRETSAEPSLAAPDDWALWLGDSAIDGIPDLTTIFENATV